MNPHYPWPEYIAYSHPMANPGPFPEQTFYHATPQQYANESASRSEFSFNSQRATVSSNNQRATVSSNNQRVAVSSNNQRNRRVRKTRSKNHRNPFDERIRHIYNAHSHQGLSPSYSEESAFAKMVPDFRPPHCGVNRCRCFDASSSITNQHMRNTGQSYVSSYCTNSQDPVNLVEHEHPFAENSYLPNSFEAENFVGGISSASNLSGTNCKLTSEEFGTTDGKNTLTKTSYENPEYQLIQQLMDVRLYTIQNPNLNSCTVSTNMENETNQIGAVTNANASLGDERIDFENSIYNSDDIKTDNKDFVVTNNKANDQLIGSPNTDKIIEEIIKIAIDLEQSPKSVESEALPTTSKQHGMMNLSQNKVVGLEELDFLEGPFLSFLDTEKLDAMQAVCVEPISVVKVEASCENFPSADDNAQMKTHDLNAINIPTHNSKAPQTDFPVFVDAQTQVTASDFGAVCEQVVTRHGEYQRREISMDGSDRGNVEDLQRKNNAGLKGRPKKDPTRIPFRFKKYHALLNLSWAKLMQVKLSSIGKKDEPETPRFLRKRKRPNKNSSASKR